MYLPDEIIDKMTEDELRDLVKKLIWVGNLSMEELCAQKDVIDSFDSLCKAQKRVAKIHGNRCFNESGLYKMEDLLREKYKTVERKETKDD